MFFRHLESYYLRSQAAVIASSATRAYFLSVSTWWFRPARTHEGHPLRALAPRDGVERLLPRIVHTVEEARREAYAAGNGVVQAQRRDEVGASAAAARLVVVVAERFRRGRDVTPPPRRARRTSPPTAPARVPGSARPTPLPLPGPPGFSASRRGKTPPRRVRGVRLAAKQGLGVHGVRDVPVALSGDGGGKTDDALPSANTRPRQHTRVAPCATRERRGGTPRLGSGAVMGATSRAPSATSTAGAPPQATRGHAARRGSRNQAGRRHERRAGRKISTPGRRASSRLAARRAPPPSRRGARNRPS